MSEIESLAKRVESIEESLIDARENLAKNNVLTEQCIKSNEKLSETMDSVRDTMVTITQSLKDFSKVTVDLAEKQDDLKVDLDETKEEIKKVSKKVDEVDEKSKVDVLKWLKENWVALAVLLGGGSLAVNKFF